LSPNQAQREKVTAAFGPGATISMRAWSSVPSNRAPRRAPSLTAFASADDRQQHERDRNEYSQHGNDSDAIRLINTVHEIGSGPDGRGSSKSPGEFRRTQNWIGGTRPGNALFVPPPVIELDRGLDAFERFLHEEKSRLPALIKAGLLHVQFETLHPFLDGNGRIGRLLVTLFLGVNGGLATPVLYQSLYLKTHRADYYRLLQEVREHGAWEAWLEFFLEGITQAANQAFDAATRIVALFKQDRERITAEGERAGSALRVHELLQQNPFATAPHLVERTGLTMPTINAALADLVHLGIVEEVTGRKRGRVFGYRAFLDILNEGTTPV